MSEREPGFYWTAYPDGKGAPEVREWHKTYCEGAWYACGEEMEYPSDRIVALSCKPLTPSDADRIKVLERQLDEALEGWRQAIAIAKAGRQ